MNAINPAPGLTIEGCRTRQQRLRDRMEEAGLDAALILDPRHVYYFSGYFVRRIYAPALLIERNGSATLSVPAPVEFPIAVDETTVYESHRIGTLVDDQIAASLVPLVPMLESLQRIGSDVAAFPSNVSARGTAQWSNIGGFVLSLRRRKDPDEVAFLLQIIRATEAAYTFAAAQLSRCATEPGTSITELDLFAGMQAIAIKHLGEPIGEFGNDFQIGAMGSAPRDRTPQPGEAAVLDLTVECRGYRSDMCRTFIVGNPTDAQKKAHEPVLRVIAHVEEQICPGVRCRDIYESARSLLEGYEGWVFPHHLGHGIGFSQHEAPRLNPHWDDVFEIGDVFTVEPGLYGQELRAGVRVEQVYSLTESGLTLLTSFPTSLDPRTVKV